MPNRKMRFTGRWIDFVDVMWREPCFDRPLVAIEGVSTAAVEAAVSRMDGLSAAENSAQAHVPGINFGAVQTGNQTQTTGYREMPKSYGTMSESTSAEPASVVGSETVALPDKSIELSKPFSGNSLENFTVDNPTYTVGQIRATFIPSSKMKSQIRRCTAVGVVALVQMLHQGWSGQAAKKQAEFNEFLKIRMFLICNGLFTLFKDGPATCKAYYLRAVCIQRKYGNTQLSSPTSLSEAEPFLEQYAERSPKDQSSVGSGENLVRADDFLGIVDKGKDEEGDLEPEGGVGLPGPSTSVKDSVPKDQGLIVFFPGIPGCGKSALCKELLNASGALGDRPVQSLMGDLIKGRYWQKVAEERRKRSYSIILADKNAPNEEVWRQIEDVCHTTGASAVPIIPDSEGTISNPFSLDALAVFIFRVLERVNHPGHLDHGSSNAGYMLLMSYHLYEGKDRQEFEGELIERFGSLVKMPLLKSERNPLPEPIKTTLEEGINLYNLHTARHGRLDSAKGSYVKEWMKWEKQLREALFGNKEYLNFIQVPFESAVREVLEQLRKITVGEYATPIIGRRKLRGIVFAAVSLPVADICSLLNNLPGKDSKVKSFFTNKNIQQRLKKAHVTLAHKRSHGVTAVASYGVFVNRNIPVELTALLYSDKVAALEARLGSVDRENIESKNAWPHVTIWTAKGIAPKEANALPQMHAEGNAMRVEIDPPATVSGPVRVF